MAPLEIPKLAVGDRVQHELLVREREDKVTKAGDPFLTLKLGNATGVLGANVWKEMVPQVQGVRPGQVVQVIGVVEEYAGRRQLKLTAPPRVVPMGGADIEQFLPRITVPEERLWAKIDAWRAEMHGPLRRAVDLFFADESFRAEFARTPGATRGHHALVGGLLLHTCEVADIARASAQTMGGNVTLVTAGALLHDIGKTKTYTVDLAGFDYTRAGMLLQHIVLGSLMLEERLRTLPPQDQLSDEQRLELHHFIQSHHGQLEFGAAVRPMTLEAEILHFADNTSAKGNDFTEAVEDAELFPSAELEFSAKRSWRLERRVWKRSHRWD
ncbi:HD domain-containing protein [Pseudogemmatithrix spongiicola]|uniref:HD domain-containing protein n=1 Tax=Pseudogemmatithrix spongiicola TaxID=3062599 RepID=A0AA49JRW8_9BACT|nr:HD domain-containing protein [Gemmatimonadaceae bacterium 'strain 138']WKW13755.1 HD domain-containing protein [Gemmatimonadaceae bacterium 'strain 318']